MAMYQTTTTTPLLVIAIPLLVVLVLATLIDLAQHRIPNAITLGATLMGLVLQGTLFGVSGFGLGLLGWGVALVCFVPFYAAGGMAAGDVKLMAAVGAFLGPAGAIVACMASLVAGAVVAGAWVAWQHRPRSTEHAIEPSGPACASRGSAGARMPYATAIALGTAFAVLEPVFMGSIVTTGGWS